jgi:NAD(P)H-dependent FMN reductase
MKIAIIVGSQRNESQSAKVGSYLAALLKKKFDASVFTIDLGKTPLPLWTEDKWTGGEKWTKEWEPISKELLSSQAFIAIAPEYAGMVSPALKNLFLLCDGGEVYHKPGMIVSVSSAGNGAYPVAELRSSSYKNSRLLWIPEHLIVRYAEKVMNNDSGELSKEDAYIRRRSEYALEVLIAYGKAMGPVQEVAAKARKDFANGM